MVDAYDDDESGKRDHKRDECGDGERQLGAKPHGRGGFLETRWSRTGQEPNKSTAVEQDGTGAEQSTAVEQDGTRTVQRHGGGSGTGQDRTGQDGSRSEARQKSRMDQG
ncbi:hypothetical protein Abr02nite_81780 [Paractinoplanes brasiliensis]|nr:hypothetical protein Abr02nite_81780 [Actinoplanes brasiliensis]